MFQLAVDEMLPCIAALAAKNGGTAEEAASGQDAGGAVEGLRRRMEGLLGDLLFREEHIRDISLAYEVGGGAGCGLESGKDKEGGNGGEEGKSSKGKRSIGKGKGVGKGKGEFASYQRSLFDKLKSTPGGTVLLPMLAGMFVRASRTEAAGVMEKGGSGVGKRGRGGEGEEGKRRISAELRMIKEMDSIGRP